MTRKPSHNRPESRGQHQKHKTQIPLTNGWGPALQDRRVQPALKGHRGPAHRRRAPWRTRRRL